MFKFKRKSRLKLVIIVLVAGIAAAGWAFGYGQNNNSDGLVLDIDFSQENYNSSTRTFADKSGNGNNAISTNAAVFAPDKDGKSAGAMSLNGVDDKLTTGINITAPQNITYSVWLYRSGTGLRTIIGSSNDLGTIRLSNGSLQMYWDSGTASQSAGFVVPSGVWGHLVAVKTDGQMKIYYNGALIWSPTVNNVNLNSINFGQQSTRVDRMFLGNMSEAKIFDRALSELEVKKLFEEAKPKLQVSSVEKGLIGHWPLNENNSNSSTGRVTDTSGYGNHGTNVGAVSAVDRFGKTGGSMEFNGVDSRVSVSYVNPVQQTSVVAWFRSIGVPAGSYHIITGGANVEISVHQTGFLRTGVVTSQGRQVFNSGSGVTDGNWHLLGMTYDGVNLVSYIDNQVTATNAVTGNLTGTAREIGRYLSNSYAARGQISDVRIYNRALSSEEMSLLYTTYLPPNLGNTLNKGLVFDFPLKSGYTKGGSAGYESFVDRSGNSIVASNNGGILGSAYLDMNAANTVNLPQNNMVDGETFTLSFWAKYRNFAYPRTFGAVKKSTPSCYQTGGKGWDFGHTFSANGVNVCIGDGTNKAWRVLVFNAGSGPSNWLNSWVHIIYVVDRGANKVTIFLNGIKQTDQMDISSITGSTKNNSPIIFGSLYGWNTDGNVSDFRMYNRPLTDAESRALFEQGRGGNGTVLNGF